MLCKLSSPLLNVSISADNPITEMSKAAVNVHADERDHFLLVSQILNFNVWPDLTEIAQYTTQLADFQKLFDHFKEMAIFNGVTSEDIKEKFSSYNPVWHNLL